MQKSITEATSRYRFLEKMSTGELLNHINFEDQSVALAVERSLGQLEHLINAVVPMIRAGGRLFYIGAGSSGRLGILDASECPPTYGVPENMVNGIIAGGDSAIRRAVENAEDDETKGFDDLQVHHITAKDFVVGIAASGKTPYVVGALKNCKLLGIPTACIVCNPDTPLAKVSDYPVEIIVGPEFVSGSTRMKAGTAQKMALNMISTSLMIKLGKVKDNKMVDLKVNNMKLRERAVRIICEETGTTPETAAELLSKYGSVRAAIEDIFKNR